MFDGALHAVVAPVAFFWLPVSSNIFEPFAEQLAIAKGFDDTDSARFFALLTLALVDGSIAVFEAKYTYDQWRPVTAIREADTDNNPDTTADPTWIQALSRDAPVSRLPLRPLPSSRRSGRGLPEIPRS